MNAAGNFLAVGVGVGDSIRDFIEDMILLSTFPILFFPIKKYKAIMQTKNANNIIGTIFEPFKSMGSHFSIVWVLCLLLIPLTFVAAYFMHKPSPKKQVAQSEYWFSLSRKSNIEYLYKGIPGEIKKSKLVKKFNVKTGIPGERPTPLPKLAGKKYWTITKKFPTKDDPETAPYFIELNVPNSEEEPYGPAPYLECNGSVSAGTYGPASAPSRDGQCNWELPGPFGLHGVAGDAEKLSEDNLGSSGCIRHTDSDITYLYKLLDPDNSKIRYYIEDI